MSVGIAFLAICIGNMFLWSTNVLPENFFPKEALKRGIHSDLTGIMYGFFSVGAISAALVYGKFIRKYDKRKQLITFYFILVGASVVFGCLKFIKDKWTFYTIAIFCRFFLGVSTSCCSVISLSYAAILYPDQVSQKSSLLEGFCGAGIICGVGIGTIMYILTSFEGVFFTIAAIVSINALIVNYFLKKLNLNNKESNDDGEVLKEENVEVADNSNEKEISYLFLFQRRRFVMTFFIILSTVFYSSGLTAVLGFYILGLGYKQIDVNAIYFTFAIAYFCGNVLLSLWKYKFDRRRILLAGMILIFFGLFTSHSLFGLPKSKYLIGGVSIFLSFATVATIGPVFPELLEILMYSLSDSNVPNLLDKSIAATSSLFVAAMNIGEFIGPVLAGILFKNLGYKGFALVYYLAIPALMITLYLSVGYGYEVFMNRNPVKEQMAAYEKLDEEGEGKEMKEIH